MSTRSFIGYQNENGFIDYVYCHFDGYPSNILPLLENYNSLQSIKELVEMGDISTLGESLANTIFYARNKGEPLNVTRNIPYYFVLTKAKKNFIDYVYVFIDNEWKFKAI